MNPVCHLIVCKWTAGEKKYWHREKWILHAEVEELGQAQRKVHSRNVFVHGAKKNHER